MPKIIYNKYAFPNVYGIYNFRKTPTTLGISFRFLITAKTENELINEEQKMLLACKTRKASSKIYYDNTEEFELTQETNGFNATCIIEKITSSYTLALSRAFSASIEMELPYTQDDCRIDAKWTAEYDTANRVSVAFVILYSASEKYNSQEIAVANTKIWPKQVLKSFFPGMIFEMIKEQYHTDQNIKRTNYTADYKQLWYAIDDPMSDEIFNDMKVTYGYEITPIVGGMLTGEVSMNQVRVYCSVNSFILNGTEARKDVYFKKLIPKLIKDAPEYLGIQGNVVDIGTIIVKLGHLSYNPSTGHFYTSFELSLLAKNNLYIAISEYIIDRTDYGISLEKLFDGKDFTYHKSRRGKTVTRTRVATASTEKNIAIPPMPTEYIQDGLNFEWVLLTEEVKEWIEYWGTTKEPIYFKSISQIFKRVCKDGTIDTVITTL